MSFNKYNIVLILIALEIIVSKCYILPKEDDFNNNNTLNWSEAESYCLSNYNSHLLSIHEPNTIINVVKEIIDIKQHHNNFWIGLSSDYQWSDGTSFANFLLKLLNKTNASNSNTQYIALKPTNTHTDNMSSHNHTKFVHTNGNSTHFWICNDSPIETTLFTSATNDRHLYNRNKNIFQYLIFIIIGILFGICCILLVCSIIVLKTCKRKILKRAKEMDNISENIKHNSHKRVKSKSNTKSKSTVDDRASVDEGIIDKLQRITDHNRRQKSKSSMNLTIDMSTGHIVMNIEDTQREQQLTKPYRKRKHKTTSSINNINIKYENEIKKSNNKFKSKPQKSVSFAADIDEGKYNRNDNDIEIELEPDEFIIDGESIEETKGISTHHMDDIIALPEHSRQITDFNDNEYETDQSNNSNHTKKENLKYKDEDGYYIDIDDEKLQKQFSEMNTNKYLKEENNNKNEIKSEITNESKEGYSKKRTNYKVNNTNDSDEEYYKEPSFNRQITDGEIV